MLMTQKMLAAAAVLAFCGLPTAAYAQVDVEAGQGGVKVQVGGQQDGQKLPEEAKRGTAYKASGMQGMAVKNAAGEDLGTVKDLVLDVGHGKVKYAALSYGGFLGLGDKLFAVPWKALQYRKGEGSERYLVLDIQEETLKNAPGFEKDAWPNFSDAEFEGNITKHYSIKAGADEPKVDVAKADIRRLDNIVGSSVRNQENKEIATVNEIVVDIDTGMVRYAALSFGGFLGLGDKLFAVPWGTFSSEFDTSNETHYLVLAVDEALLKKAPGFDQDNWPSLGDPKFGADVDAYYESTRKRDE